MKTPKLLLSCLRRKYGNEKPLNIKYWALGNEIDGPWQMGQKSAEDNCKFAREAAKLMQWVDRNIKLIACGASNYITLAHPTEASGIGRSKLTERSWIDHLAVAWPVFPTRPAQTKGLKPESRAGCLNDTLK